MAYSIANVNLKNTEDDSWRIVSISEDGAIKKDRGTLFCIAEIVKADDEKVRVIEELVEYVLSIFSDQDVFSTPRSEDLLEHLLDEINRKFAETSAHMKAGSFSDLSFIVGIIHNENLVISSHGTLQAWLLHPFAKNKDEEKYRWANILENVKQRTDDTHSKLFDQVIAGELSEKQTFVITTKNLWQVLTQDKFKDLILNNRIRRIKQVLVKTINTLPSEVDMAFLIGKDGPTKSKKGALKASIVDAEENNDDPQEVSEKHHALAKLFGGSKDKKDKPSIEEDNEPQDNRKMDRATSISSHVEDKLSNGKGWYARLPKKSKVIFVILIVLIGGSIQSIYWINSRNQDEKISVQFDERLLEIQNIRDEAEAKLIYNDKESARELINQALQLTYNLPQRYEKEEVQKKELEEELEETLLEIDGLETLSSIQSVFTFPPEAAPTSVHSIIALRSGFMVVVTDKAALTVIDVPSQTSNAIPYDSVEGTIDDASWDASTNTLYLLTSENKIFEVSLSNVEFEDSSLSTKSLDFSIADIGDPSVFTVYANRLYAADPADRQIKKLELANNNVSSWLTNEQAGLGAVVDIAIDSNIYIATQSELSQYFRGERTDWKVSGLTPPPATVVDIHADGDDEFIYLLDNATTRIIILNTSGQLFKQYTSPQLISPAAFAINESTKEVYILDGQTIFRVPITWLTEISE